jgi:prevent-host-death family protein
MEQFLTASEARQKWLRLLDDVKDGERIVITRRGKPAAVVIDFERHQLLMELARLWQDPEALRILRAGHEDLEKGRVVRVKGPLTIKNILKVAREKGVFKARV